MDKIRSCNEFRLINETPWSVRLGFALLAIFVFVATMPQDDVRPGAGFRSAMYVLLLFLLVYSVLNTRDSVMKNPHPAWWRLLHGANLWYCLLVGVFLAVPVKEGVVLMGWIFPEVERPAVEQKAEGTLGADHLDCAITGETVLRQLRSIWFLAHCVGWWAKMLMLRDFGTCLVYSTFFELLELTLQSIVPEFQECWWDSIFMDWLFANTLIGMMLGRWTLWYLNLTDFPWSGDRLYVNMNKGLINQIRPCLFERLGCLLPSSWSEYDWNPTNDPVTMALNAVIWITMAVGEVNSFFLINVLHLPRNHLFNAGRQAFLCMTAVPAVAEWYEYTRHARAHSLGRGGFEYARRFEGRKPRIGHFTWLLVMSVSFETAAVVKYTVSFGQVGSVLPGPEYWGPWVASGAIFSVYFAFHCWFFYRGQGIFPNWLRALKSISCLPLFLLVRLYAF